MDWTDPRWRSSKAGRACYAKFGRDKNKQAPKEIHEEFDRNRQGELFKLWVKNDGNWLEICYETGIKTRNIESTNSKYRLQSRSEIETKFGDKGSSCSKPRLALSRVCLMQTRITCCFTEILAPRGEDLSETTCYA